MNIEKIVYPFCHFETASRIMADFCSRKKTSGTLQLERNRFKNNKQLPANKMENVQVWHSS